MSRKTALFTLVIGLSFSGRWLLADESAGAAPASQESKNSSGTSSKPIPEMPQKPQSESEPIPVRSLPKMTMQKYQSGTNEPIEESLSVSNRNVIQDYAKYGANSGTMLRNASPGLARLSALAPANRSLNRPGEVFISRNGKAIVQTNPDGSQTLTPIGGSGNWNGAYSRSKTTAPRPSLISNHFMRPDEAVVIGASRVNEDAVNSMQTSTIVTPTAPTAMPRIAGAPSTGADSAVAAAAAPHSNAPMANPTPPAQTAAKTAQPVDPASIRVDRGTQKIVPLSTPPAPPLDKWEQYFMDVSKYYNFTPQQHEAGLRVLTHLRSRATQYRMSRAPQYDAVEKISDKSARDRQLGELNRPIDGMFGELKARLENLPTLQQKHDANGPAPKG
ncbi:MAG: hypothetical protein KF841_03985 [Phycisphaerae bacterium]|nr:hypothetical protein [Phycisphaerae bacterium]